MEVARCHFLRCSAVGLSLESFNALDWFVRDSVFEDCGYGVSNTYGAGHYHVYDSLFPARNLIEGRGLSPGRAGLLLLYLGTTDVASHKCTLPAVPPLDAPNADSPDNRFHPLRRRRPSPLAGNRPAFRRFP